MPKKKPVANKLREEQAAKRKEFMNKLRSLSSTEIRAGFVEAGVLTRNGRPAAQYL